MPVGQCALCLEAQELRNSHFLSAGFYRIMRDASDENPVLVNKSAAVMSSAQARGHLLCAECERRFNEGGEDWVLKNCWRSPTHFPLHSALTSAQPFVADDSFRSYEGTKISGIEIDKLAYFGASIFWRAAVRDWTVGKDKEQRILLGPFQEALRRYLLGLTAMPDGAVLLITLSAALDDLHNCVSVMPWFFDRTVHYRSYRFIVPGISFEMLFGMSIPKSIRHICSARRGFLYMSEKRDADLLKTMATMANSAEGKGRLAQHLTSADP